ncbi:MAG: ATP-dependent DNA helicase, partial [Steroidobacteraceae bacterium]
MTYQVSVRALCSFTAKRGDLDTRFTPAPSALEGIQGHRIVASRRGSGYKAEVSLRTEEGTLTVRGRADGYDVKESRVEECKTFRGEFTRIPDNRHSLHWAQVQTYGAQLCRRDALEELELALVYFDIDNQEETVLKERLSAARLEALFAERCEQFSAWARFEADRIEQRNASLQAMQFPYEFHTGQRQLAESVYRAAATSQCLLAQAPTGVGKTLGTLFPMLKALGEAKIDKVLYLTAKGTGRALALDGVRKLHGAGAQVRVLDLVARDKACANPGRQCNGESCPLAKGFYDRLGDARATARALSTMDQSSIRNVALAHHVCPYYLSQEMVRWADVVIADYNHYFDHG